MVALGILVNILRVKATLRSRDVSKLGKLNDPTRVELMKRLDKLGTIFYMTEDNRLPLCIFKTLNWTMKYGYCEYSSTAFAGTGILLTGVLNDLPGGSKYGEQALRLLAQSESQITAARTMLLVYGFTYAYTTPLRGLLKPLLRGYDIGLQTG